MPRAEGRDLRLRKAGDGAPEDGGQGRPFRQVRLRRPGARLGLRLRRGQDCRRAHRHRGYRGGDVRVRVQPPVVLVLRGPGAGREDDSGEGNRGAGVRLRVWCPDVHLLQAGGEESTEARRRGHVLRQVRLHRTGACLRLRLQGHADGAHGDRAGAAQGLNSVKTRSCIRAAKQKQCHVHFHKIHETLRRAGHGVGVGVLDALALFLGCERVI